MNKKTTILLALFASSALAGCQFHARSAEEYEKETRQVIETKKEDLKACYDEVLKKDKKAEGTVTVKFLVEAKTGVIKDVKVNEKKTTAPESLSACVAKTLEGLKIDPPDARDGVVTWSYDFTANKPKQL